MDHGMRVLLIALACVASLTTWPRVLRLLDLAEVHVRVLEPAGDGAMPAMRQGVPSSQIQQA